MANWASSNSACASAKPLGRSTSLELEAIIKDYRGATRSGIDRVGFLAASWPETSPGTLVKREVRDGPWGPVSEGDTVARRSDGDGVEIVTIKNPPVNALSSRVLADLGATVGALASAPEVRAVVITGDGTYFSAGADLKELATIDAARARGMVETGQQLFSRIASSASARSSPRSTVSRSAEDSSSPSRAT